MSRSLLFGIVILDAGGILLLFAGVEVYQNGWNQFAQGPVEVGLGCVLAGGILVLLGLRALEDRKRLKLEGRVAKGTVTAITKRWYQGFSGVENPLYLLRYRYQDPLGRSHEGDASLPQLEAFTWRVGDIGAVRFDDRHPKRSIWIGEDAPDGRTGVSASRSGDLSVSPNAVVRPDRGPFAFRLATRSGSLRYGIFLLVLGLLFLSFGLFGAILRWGGKGQSVEWVVFLVLGGLVASFGARRSLAGLREVKNTLRLMRKGLLTAGTVTLVKEEAKGVSDYRGRAIMFSHWIIEYRYCDHAGQTHFGAGDLSGREAVSWRAGDAGLIRYDREHPEDSMWVGRA